MPAMISSQLSSILEDYFQEPGRGDMPAPDADSAAVVSGESPAITVTSAPDAQSVMLFAEAGRHPRAHLRPEGKWVVVGEEDLDDDDFDDFDELDSLGGDSPAASKCTMVYDQRVGAIALACISPATALDAPTFARWVQRFADELDRLRSIVDEWHHDTAEDRVSSIETHHFLLWA